MKKYRYFWKYAPDWAEHGVTDKEGYMYWTVQEPFICGQRDVICWQAVQRNEFGRDRELAKDWRNSVEKRPAEFMLQDAGKS